MAWEASPCRVPSALPLPSTQSAFRRSCWGWLPSPTRTLHSCREVYPSLDQDLHAALRFTNERHVGELLGAPYIRLVEQFAGDIDRVHEGLTSAIRAGLDENADVNISQYVQEAAHLRRFLG